MPRPPRQPRRHIPLPPPLEARLGDRVELHVWGGNGYSVHVGHVEALEPQNDGTGDVVLILAEDKDAAYFTWQVAEVWRS